jgi:hypothetical protein
MHLNSSGDLTFIEPEVKREKAVLDATNVGGELLLKK